MTIHLDLNWLTVLGLWLGPSFGSFLAWHLSKKDSRKTAEFLEGYLEEIKASIVSDLCMCKKCRKRRAAG